VVRDIEAGRLVRPIRKVVKTDLSYFFVAPRDYFNLPKVAAFRDRLMDHFAVFDPPV